MRKHFWTRTGVSLLLTILFVLAVSSSASAWTATGLKAVSSSGDQFYNYDFISKSVSTAGVDWPVTLIFTGNASVSKIKSAYRTRGWSNPFASTMYGYANDGSGFLFASDAGVKTFASKSPHLRLYAPGGRMYNSTWGYYVIATTHYDNAELSKPPTQWFGMSEDAATAAVQTAIKAWGASSVLLNSVALDNAKYGEDVGPSGERHRWQCDGMATLIRVP